MEASAILADPLERPVSNTWWSLQRWEVTEFFRRTTEFSSSKDGWWPSAWVILKGSYVFPENLKLSGVSVVSYTSASAFFTKLWGAGWELAVYRPVFNVETKQGFLEVGWAAWPLGSPHWEQQSLEWNVAGLGTTGMMQELCLPQRLLQGLLVSTWKWITHPYFYHCLP